MRCRRSSPGCTIVGLCSSRSSRSSEAPRPPATATPRRARPAA
ncbi:hypothetical protein ACFPRL_12305 [Pseudoclavibacter helvolus]